MTVGQLHGTELKDRLRRHTLPQESHVLDSPSMLAPQEGQALWPAIFLSCWLIYLFVIKDSGVKISCQGP
ncbi:hypothetical protein BJY00DRAFT_83553 [Aspergillus carlsbadensis]|nr:hypothetical protein BJY00DRAFT_83553 [Aspergillus carlsbadensis]